MLVFLADVKQNSQLTPFVQNIFLTNQHKKTGSL